MVKVIYSEGHFLESTAPEAVGWNLGLRCNLDFYLQTSVISVPTTSFQVVSFSFVWMSQPQLELNNILAGGVIFQQSRFEILVLF